LRGMSLLTKFIIIGCMVSILPVVFVGIFSYIRSSNQVQVQANTAEVQFIKQVNSNIEQILMTVNHTLNNLGDSTILSEVMTKSLTEDDFKIYNDLRQEIIHLQAFDTMVEDVILLDNEQNWLIKNSGLYRLDKRKDYERFLSYFELDSNSEWTLIKNDDFVESISNVNCAYTISLVKKLPVRHVKKKALAFANIPACTLSSMIHQVEGKEDVMIVNEQGYIMLHSDHSFIGSHIADIGYFDSASPFTDQSGQFRTIYNNHPYTVTYYQSDFNEWNYISIVSIDELTKSSKEIGWFTLFISLFIIGLSVAVVMLSTRKLYSPVNRLMKLVSDTEIGPTNAGSNDMQIIEHHMKKLFSSHSKLEREIKDHTGQVRSLYLNQLFTGSVKPSEIAGKLSYFGLERGTKWKLMTVFTLQIDTLEHTRFAQSDMELLLFAVSNIIEETLPIESRFPSVWVDQTLVILVGLYDDYETDINAFVYTKTEQLQALIQTYIGLSVSIGISLPFRSIEKASRAYYEGVEALKHRINLGKGVIIPFRNLNSGRHSVLYSYPQLQEMELMDAVKISAEEEAIAALRSWMERAFVKTQSPQEIQVSMMRLLNKFLVVQQEAGISFDQIGAGQRPLYEDLLSLHVRDEIEEWFKSKMITPLIQVFSGRRDSEYQNLSEKMMDMIHNYYDTDFTLEECASRLHYNANYLSSVFKKEMNCTFTEYLGNYRINVAKTWLGETDMTVKEISEKLRYNNSQNFIRSFRKLVGMTPGEYRSKFS
jgi:AraC-like DNA-binding protein